MELEIQVDLHYKVRISPPTRERGISKRPPKLSLVGDTIVFR